MKSLFSVALAAVSLVSFVTAVPNELQRRATSYTPVTGPVGAGVASRLPVQKFQTQDRDGFNMYLWALHVIQNIKETNELSWFSIAGIHGRPFIPWGEAVSSSQDPTTGYCTHDSALFATWHRPYCALIEQRLVAHAINEAKKFKGADASKYLAAAKRVRLAYWDWSTSDLKSAVPTIVATQRVTVTAPGPGGAPKTTSIPNPLYQYTFLDSALKRKYFTDQFVTDAASRRQPPADGKSSRNNLVTAAMTNTYTSRRQNTYNLFSIPNFDSFSNTAFSIGGQPNSWTSVESIHNDIHNICGGDSGHMTYLDMSAFDPIFFLHHAQVDRLVAMYQVLHPTAKITPQPAAGTFARRVKAGDTDTITTPLHPFRKTGGALYTSEDVSTAASIWSLGYEYPEVPYSYKSRPANDLKVFTTGQVNSLYGPTNSATRKRSYVGNHSRREWICHILFAPADIQGSAEVLVFLGAKASPSSNGYERRIQKSLVGSGASFGKQAKVTDYSKKITATVPLTEALIEAGVDVDNVRETVKYLRLHLTWTVQRGTENIDVSSVPSLIVGVSSSKVDYGGLEQLPTWGEFTSYFEVTQNKTGGFTRKHSSIVDSKDSPNLLAPSQDDSKSSSASTDSY